MSLHTRTLYAFQEDVCWNSSFKTNWLRNMCKVSSVCVHSTCPLPIITRCDCMRQNKLFAHKRWPTGRTMHCFLHGPRVFSKGDGYSRDIQILGSRDFKYRSDYFCVFFFLYRHCSLLFSRVKRWPLPDNTAIRHKAASRIYN